MIFISFGGHSCTTCARCLVKCGATALAYVPEVFGDLGSHFLLRKLRYELVQAIGPVTHASALEVFKVNMVPVHARVHIATFDLIEDN